MKIILFIIQKEFKQIFRNKAMLPLLFVMPFMQLLILSYAASFEIKNIKIGFVNHDNGNTFKVVKETLQDLGYKVYAKVLNAKDFGIPQNRERIYI